MSWLGSLNFYVVQWFGVRLYRVCAEPDGPTLWWGLKTNVRPLSGYSGRPYRRILS